MSDRRPILIGMNNPLSTEPGHELYPAPVGCTGWRIWTFLRDLDAELWTRTYYVRALDRRNLVRGKWNPETARANARLMMASLRGSERVVVLLGDKVRQAFGFEKMLLHPLDYNGVQYRQMPHPSGLCRFYNDPVGRRLLATLIHELVDAGSIRSESSESS